VTFEEALDRAEAEHQALFVTQDGTHFIDRTVTLRAESREYRLLVGVDAMRSLVPAHGLGPGVALLAL